MVRGIKEADLPWIYAAYKMGAFADLEPDLSKGELVQKFLEISATASEVHTLIAPLTWPNSAQHGSPAPVGLIMTGESQHRVEPHAIWFPWATDRNKLETILKYLKQERVGHTIVVYSKEENIPFFDRVKAYGLIRRAGTLRDWFSDMSQAAVYQTFRPKHLRE